MIADDAALEPIARRAGDGDVGRSRSRGRAATCSAPRCSPTDGVDLGKVSDVVSPSTSHGGGSATWSATRSRPPTAWQQLGREEHRLLIPLPDTIAVSGEHVMVPASAKDFVGHDLAGFGAAVDRLPLPSWGARTMLFSDAQGPQAGRHEHGRHRRQGRRLPRRPRDPLRRCARVQEDRARLRRRVGRPHRRRRRRGHDRPGRRRSPIPTSGRPTSRPRTAQLLKKRVLTDGGEELGTGPRHRLRPRERRALTTLVLHGRRRSPRRGSRGWLVRRGRERSDLIDHASPGDERLPR